jgi:gluconolactonase
MNFFSSTKFINYTSHKKILTTVTQLKTYLLKCLAILYFISVYSITECNAQDTSNLLYPYDPASQQQQGVPKGEVLQFKFKDSKIFPGTQRTYWIYITDGYKPEVPACLYFNLDGVQCNAPVVFDNLIHDGQMPITIGVFLQAGNIKKDDSTIVRFNRSNEFDNLNDRFARFILEEILPDVEKQKTTNGRAIHVSKNANDLALGGASSGAICAFTAAWQRPDAFSRVFSAIGTYVGMRGGDQYPALIRKTEPKPIRIFLQDGDKDTWNPLFGNWFKGNIDMEAALNFAGYEVRHEWGEGGHNIQHATAIFPDAMRWLWKGWPNPVNSGLSANNMLRKILVSNELWKPVETKLPVTGNLTATAKGDILFSDSTRHIYRMADDGKISLFTTNSLQQNFIVSDSSEQLYLVDKLLKKVFLYNHLKKKKTIVSNMPVDQVLIAPGNNKYFIVSGNSDKETGKIWLQRENGKTALLDEDVYIGSALAMSPDKNQLLVSRKHSHWVYSYTLGQNGLLSNKQDLYWLHNTDNDDFDAISSMAVDNNGNLYVATAMGVQVCDQNGRVRAILPLPGGAITQLCFGGEKFNTLFIVCDGKLYKRKLSAYSTPSWYPPISIPTQGGG